MNAVRLSILVVVLGLLWSGPAAAWEWLRRENGDVKDGNAQLAKGQHEKALSSYGSAAKALPDEGRIHLNRALALMKGGEQKLDEAMQALTLATASDVPDDVLARAHFNLGNAFFKKQDFAEAMKQYRRSLMLTPGNRDAAWNLEIAARKKKEQDEQKKKDQEENEKQDQQDQQEEQDQQEQDQQKQDEQKQDEQKQDQQKQDEQKQDEQKQDQQKQDQQKQDQQKQDQQKQQQEQQQQQKPRSEQQKEMDRVLQALENEDNNFHKDRARQLGAVEVAGEKDW